MMGDTFFSTTLPLNSLDEVVPAYAKENVLDHMEFKDIPQDRWPRPVIGNEGVPPEFLAAGKYPFEPGTDVPEGQEIVREGPTGAGARLDRRMRRPQLTNLIEVGQPVLPDEGQLRLNPDNVPEDPSAVSADQIGVRRARGRDFMDTAMRRLPGPVMRSRLRMSRAQLSGLGEEATLLQQATMLPIELTITSLRNKEATLMVNAPAALEQLASAYAKLRSDVYGYYEQMKANPALLTSLAVPFTASAATYKVVLDTAIKKLAEAQKAVQKQQQAQAKAAATAAAGGTAKPFWAQPMVLLPAVMAAGALGFLAFRRKG